MISKSLRDKSKLFVVRLFVFAPAVVIRLLEVLLNGNAQPQSTLISMQLQLRIGLCSRIHCDEMPSSWMPELRQMW
ncbi:hypothetical protein Plhal703r1_c06g0036451 [Plasmopara halstedii]